jgi:serine/threonine protein kinase/Flp pilus assembly protein TadD
MASSLDPTEPNDPRDDKALPLTAFQNVNRLCQQFELALKEGRQECIEDFLTTCAEEERTLLLRELMALELEYAIRSREHVDRDTYLKRFPGREAIVELVFRESERVIPPHDPNSPGGRTAPYDVQRDGQPDPSDEQTIPAVLSSHPRYRIIRLLGRGGMGVVFLAEHKVMERLEAIKVVRQDLVSNPQLDNRFRQEVKAAARLSHPNVVAAYDADTIGDCHFLAMEYVPGIDLAALVERDGPLSVECACGYICQAAAGLQHAHEHNMVHRDIKPQNLMLAENGCVKVLDFGLAQMRAEAGPAGPTTCSGIFLGSFDYMAPEQADNPAAADIRADIYSLGCTLYFLLTGRPPFPTGNWYQKLKDHVEKTPPEVFSIRQDAPQELSAIVLRMMAKAPQDRFQTPQDVVSALAPLVRNGSDERDIASSDRTSPSSKTHARRWYAAAALLCLGLIVVVKSLPSAHDPVLDNPEAKNCVKIGNANVEERTEESLRGAVGEFEHALQLVPKSALVHAALANAYNLQYDYGWVPADVVFPNAKNEALEAIRLNDNLSEAHLALACTLGGYELIWGDAEKEYQKALYLNPNSAQAHHWYAWLLVQQQRFKEADREIKKAYELEPTYIIACNLGRIHYFSRKNDEAQKDYEAAMRLKGDFRKVYRDRGFLFAEMGNLTRALDELKRSEGLSEHGNDLIAAKAYAYAKSGRTTEDRSRALSLLKELEKWDGNKSLAYEIATIYAALRDKENAFKWLRTAFDKKSPWRAYIYVDPKLDRIREDPRFQPFLKEARLLPSP